MRIKLSMKLILLCAIWMGCYSNDITTHAKPIRIMPLGDSITVGFSNMTDPWSTPFSYGYRSYLYDKLTEANYDIQFVGLSQEPWNNPWGAGFPKISTGTDLRLIDQDYHEGYGGETLSQLMNHQLANWSASTHPNIEAMIIVSQPDIILLMIGTNDLIDAMKNIDVYINRILTAKPSVKLIVAQITPRTYYQEDTVTYNSLIRDITSRIY